jgi:hypothetical protein
MGSMAYFGIDRCCAVLWSRAPSMGGELEILLGTRRIGTVICRCAESSCSVVSLAAARQPSVTRCQW